MKFYAFGRNWSLFPRSQGRTTCLCPEPDASFQTTRPRPSFYLSFCYMLCLYVEELLAPVETSGWSNTPLHMSVTAYRVHSQLSGGPLPLPQPALVQTPYDGRRYFPLHNYLNGRRRYTIVRIWYEAVRLVQLAVLTVTAGFSSTHSQLASLPKRMLFLHSHNYMFRQKGNFTHAEFFYYWARG
jgi:hypothetical protein